MKRVLSSNQFSLEKSNKLYIFRVCICSKQNVCFDFFYYFYLILTNLALKKAISVTYPSVYL